jgi:hypothetical protein
MVFRFNGLRRLERPEASHLPRFQWLAEMDNELRSISSKVLFLIVSTKFHDGFVHSARAGNVHLAVLEVIRLRE